MKKTVLIIAAVLVGVCGIGAVGLMKARGANAGKSDNKDAYKVSLGTITESVVDTGPIDAIQSVEVKSQVSGRLAKLLVQEGDVVKKGDLIAIIDPQETRNKVQSDEAQMRGALSSVRRTGIEITQRRVTAQAALDRARLRLQQLQQELNIQPNLTKLAIQQAEASYKSAMQKRDQLVKVTQPNERAAVSTALGDAKAGVGNAENDFSRKKIQYERGFISLREYEDAQLNLQLAQSKLKNAQERQDRLRQSEELELAQANEGIRQARAELDRAVANKIQDTTKRQEYMTAAASVRDAEAGLRDADALAESRNQAQATVDQISNSLSESRRLLGETEIRAPIDGVVSKKLIQEGELVTSIGSFSNGSPIVRIEDRTTMIVKLDINEIDVAKLELESKAMISVDAIPGVEFTGLVSKIAPSSTATATGQSSTDQVVRYEVEVRFNEMNPALKSGMNAKCTVNIKELKNVVTIPAEYLGTDDKGTFVMTKPAATAKPGDTSNRVDVVVGAKSGATIEIKSGLKAGQEIVKPEFTGPARRGAFN